LPAAPPLTYLSQRRPRVSLVTGLLPQPCLCLVTDRTAVGGDTKDMMQRVAQAVLGGVDLVQVREKDLPAGELLELTRFLLESVGSRAKLIINDRADIALIAGAHGVQLGEEGLPVAAARKIVGNSGLIGRSVHSVAAATQAQDYGANFLIVGTMFASRSHPGEAPTGPGLMQEISGKCQLPLIGIGGITPENASAVIQAGASGVAVITNVLAASDPRAAASELKEAICEAWRVHENQNGNQASVG
jgi:thiamine-phosphate diphosphorylase